MCIAVVAESQRSNILLEDMPIFPCLKCLRESSWRPFQKGQMVFLKIHGTTLLMRHPVQALLHLSLANTVVHFKGNII